jgi:anti-anti-sigma factor
MEYTYSQQAQHHQLDLIGTFTFSDNAKFRQIVSNLRDSDADSITLDLRNLQFIDSAALGMLLLLHDEANKKAIKVVLAGADGQIKKMLQLSNFEEIFTVQYA